VSPRRAQRATVAVAVDPTVLNARLATQTYLTPAEAAHYTRRSSVNAFRQWAYRERIPSCHMGRAVLYLRRDIDKAIQPEHVRLAGRQSA